VQLGVLLDQLVEELSPGAQVGLGLGRHAPSLCNGRLWRDGRRGSTISAALGNDVSRNSSTSLVALQPSKSTQPEASPFRPLQIGAGVAERVGDNSILVPQVELGSGLSGGHIDQQDWDRTSIRGVVAGHVHHDMWAEHASEVPIDCVLESLG